MLYFIRFIIGLFASIIISYMAYEKQALTISGALGAIILGTGIFFSSGLYGSFLIGLFFVTSTVFSFMKKKIKKEIEKQYEKSGGRDFFQVFANGGVGLFYSILYFFTLSPTYLILIGAAFAASNGDTWASELGVLGRSTPIHLRTFKKVPRGTSGAVSFFGSVVSLFGSMLIAFSAVIMIYIFQLNIFPFSLWRVFFLISFGGVLGSFLDSLLGATIQAIYYNEELKKETEKSYSDGKTNVLIRGYKLFNNDLVNLSSIFLSSISISFFILIW